MKRALRIIGGGLLLTLLAASAVRGFRGWRASTMAKQERLALARAERLLQEGKAADALNLADALLQTQTNAAWQRIQIEALVAMPDVPRLAELFRQAPERLIAHEPASLVLANALIHAHKPADAAKVRQAWRGREQHQDAWLVLDCDTLVLAEKRSEAERLLRAHPLPGKQEVTRLTRLAVLTASHDLPEAWRLLSQAAAVDPRNSDVRSFRGQILETAGQPGPARLEYVAALVAMPQSPLFRDQLADFYLRHHYLDLALDTWKETLTASSPDFMRLKAQFLGRVLRPVELPKATEPSADGLDPLVSQLAGTKADRFFDPAAFDQLPRARQYASARPEVFWLRLLDALQTHQEKRAKELLIGEPARLQAWDPDLASALGRILYFREKHSLNPPWPLPAVSLPETNRPAFFVALESAARRERESAGHQVTLPAEMAAWLAGSNAVSGAFLAAGWREAALRLANGAQAVRGEPEWFTSSLAQALRLNRTPQAALAFLGEGELPPTADLLRAEILVELGRKPEALPKLEVLAKMDSGVGFRAAYLLALDAAAQHHPDQARQRIAEQPLLASADLGFEMLARLALTEGRIQEAEGFYRKAARTSVEAKTWFARRAFADHHWAEARQLTNELIELLPDSAQLRQNLLAIDSAEGRL